MAAPNPLAEQADPDVDDRDLLERYRSGEVGAASLLYDQHRDGLYSYARALLGEAAASEDVVQEAFLKLLEYARPVSSVRAFLFTVARNLATDALRESAVRGKCRTDLARRGLGHAAEEDDRLSGLQKAVLAELDLLPDEQREAVVLKVYGRLTFPQIGDVTGVPPGTAASRYRYALAKLAERLTERQEHA